jgi:hypothetical protein
MKCIGGRATACIAGSGGCDPTAPSSGYSTAVRIDDPSAEYCVGESDDGGTFFSTYAPELYTTCAR